MKLQAEVVGKQLCRNRQCALDQAIFHGFLQREAGKYHAPAGERYPLWVEKMLASTTMVPAAGYGCGDFSPDKSAFTYPEGRRKQTSLLLEGTCCGLSANAETLEILRIPVIGAIAVNYPANHTKTCKHQNQQDCSYDLCLAH